MTAGWAWALGMYSVDREWRAQPEATLARVAALGFAGVESYGDPVMPGARLARYLADCGLRHAGAHVEWRRLQPACMAATLADCAAAGVECVVVPALGGPWEIGHTQAQDGPAVWERHAAWLNGLVIAAARHGMRAGYHTHEHEFCVRYADGRTPWQILLAESDPGLVLELDTGNCLAAGVDPVVALHQAGARAAWVHAKPYGHACGWETTVGAPTDASDWAAILAACVGATRRWLVFEHESATVAPGFSGVEANVTALRTLCSRLGEDLEEHHPDPGEQ